MIDKKLHICIDGLNIALQQGTGIATYARQLCDVLSRQNCKISLLFDKALDETAPENLYEISFYEALNNLSDKELKPAGGFLASVNYYLPLFMKSFLSFFKISSAKEHHFSGIMEKDSAQSRLPEFDGVYNVPRLFKVALVYFHLTKKLLPIKLNPTPDIMHWTCAIPAKVIGAKNYYTLHDVIPLKMPEVLKENDNIDFYRVLFSQIAQSADKIITVSEFSKQDIVAELKVDANKVINTYQAVHLENTCSEQEMQFSRHQLESQFNLSSRNYFLFIGAIEPKKNVVRLIQAYLRANVSQKLVIVGGLGWRSDEEQRLFEQHADNIIYLRYVENDALKTLLRYARALVFPSLYEGFGLPVLEAMTLGTPVITSNVSSLPEIVGDAASLINPYDVNELAAAIVRLSQDDALCVELSEKGLKQAQCFSEQAYTQRLLTLYSAHVP